MSKTVRFSFAAGLAIVLLLIGYFAVIPSLQISNYKKLEPKQTEVNDKMVRVYDSFKRDVFTKLDTKAASDAVDIQAGQEAVKDAQSAINANQTALTQFKPLPLLFWNHKYQVVTDADRQEEAYFSKSRTFLKDYTDLLSYMDKENALQTRAEAVGTNLDSLSSAASPTVLADTLDTDAGKLQTILDDEQKLTPPDYLAAYQKTNVSEGGKLIGTLRDLATATRALDLNKIEALGASVEQQAKDLATQGTSLITQLHKDSKIEVDILELRSINDKLTKDYAQL